MDGPELKLCRIRLTIGDVEACPEGACPFWEEHALERGCGLERLELDLERPDLARYLVDLRQALEEARDVREREAARRVFAGLVPTELSGH